MVDSKENDKFDLGVKGLTVKFQQENNQAVECCRWHLFFFSSGNSCFRWWRTGTQAAWRWEEFAIKKTHCKETSGEFVLDSNLICPKKYVQPFTPEHQYASSPDCSVYMYLQIPCGTYKENLSIYQELEFAIITFYYSYDLYVWFRGDFVWKN